MCLSEACLEKGVSMSAQLTNIKTTVYVNFLNSLKISIKNVTNISFEPSTESDCSVE